MILAILHSGVVVGVGSGITRSPTQSKSPEALFLRLDPALDFSRESLSSDEDERVETIVTAPLWRKQLKREVQKRILSLEFTSSSALLQGCYTWRHDSVLKTLFNFVEGKLQEGFVIFADLAG